jgi:phospholipase C
MECYAPDAVPVLSTLAKQFAVCDHWHSSVPSQTFCNRSFLHAASSSGAVVNLPFSHWASGNTAETILERIESAKERGLSWKVYFDRTNVFPLTGLVHYARLERFLDSHFNYMEQFFEDARTGNLPSYAFIEPRLFLDHNDQHPQIRIWGELIHSSVLAGELLISQVYDAIRLSDTVGGSNCENTLLIITYDEHGGCYDHVPPPGAAPPDPARPQGQMGFTFDRLGVRVPAVLVSAYIEPGTVVNTTFDHTSVIKTVSEKWDLGSLTDRDRSAADLSGVFNRSTPRGRQEWPVVRPRELPAGRASNSNHLLNDLQRAIVGVAHAIGGESATPLSEGMRVFEAIEHMKRTVGSRAFCG